MEPNLYSFIKEIVPIIKLLDSRRRHGITSWIRKEGTHITGLSIDLAAREGLGYQRRSSGKLPNYNDDKQYINEIKSILYDIKRCAPNLRLLGVENTHLHLSWKPFYPGQNDLMFVTVHKKEVDGYDKFTIISQI